MLQRTAGGGVGRAADVLDEMVEHLGDAGVRDALADLAGDGGAHAEAEDVAQGLEVHALFEAEGVEHDAFDGLPEEELFADFVELGAHGDEVAVALLGAGAYLARVAAIAGTFSWRSRTVPSSKKQRHWGSSRRRSR